MFQVSRIIMIKNDTKINGNVSGFMDPESHAPNRALQWQRHLHLRLQGLLLASLVNDIPYICHFFYTVKIFGE